MSSILERIAWVVAILAFVPAVVASGGLVLAAVLAGAVLSTYYGGRYGLRVYEQSKVGAEAGNPQNSFLGDSDRWRRNE